MLQDIRDLQDNLRTLEQQSEAAERQVSESQARCEEARYAHPHLNYQFWSYDDIASCLTSGYRSQLMVIDYQRAAALKEMDEVTEQLQRGRQLQKMLEHDSQQRQKLAEGGTLRCGMSPEEVG